MLFTTGAAHGQGMPDGWAEQHIMDTAWGSVMDDAAKRPDAGSSGQDKPKDKAKPDAKASSAAGAATPLRYTPSLQRRRANMARFVAAMRKTDPEGADRLAVVSASTDLIAQMDAGVRKLGLRVDDLADVYALYWTSAWLGAQGRTEELPAAQLQAVSRQVAATLVKTEPVASADDATKQALAEEMLMHAALIVASVDMAKADRTLMPTVKSAVAQGARAIGLEVGAFTLTDEGFRPR